RHGEEPEEIGVRTLPLRIGPGERRIRESPGMAAALAGRGEAGSRVRPGLRWAVRDYEEVGPASGFRSSEFLVDYGPLEAIEREAVRTADPGEAAQARGQLAGKVVLLGDLEGTDGHVIPGRRRPVPGVLIHACGVETLFRWPLLRLTEYGRITVDALLSLSVLGLAHLVQRLLRGRAASMTEETLHRRITWGVVLAAGLFAVLLVRTTRLMWDDFILVLLALLAHGKIEGWLTSAARWGVSATSRLLGLKPGTEAGS
ncbi:MAG TPA: hypothetical protein VFU47_05410, partial [Armatimonadota bacterium]|nr:hypothetical protein [Armatimonadota bacterium]